MTIAASTAETGAERDNLRGIGLMVASMAGFALEDMFIKWAAADLPPGEILLVMGLVGTPIFALLAAAQGRRVWSPAFLHRAVVARNLGEMVGTWGFITALALVPLATVSSVLQAMPLVVTCGAALFLGQTVGWRRWSAILVGFAGVLIVIRPGMAGFDPKALWTVLAVLGLSLRDLATRRVPTTIGTMEVGCWGFLSVAVLGALMLAASGGFVVPTPAQTFYLSGALVFGMAAYWAITAAMRTGEIPAVTPFRYARLLFALIIGVTVFGERPDTATLVGASLIILSGLYMFARERRMIALTLPKRAAPQ